MQTHLSQVLSDLENETLVAIGLDVKSVEDSWEIIRVEVDVDDWTNDGLRWVDEECERNVWFTGSDRLRHTLMAPICLPPEAGVARPRAVMETRLRWRKSQWNVPWQVGAACAEDPGRHLPTIGSATITKPR